MSIAERLSQVAAKLEASEGVKEALSNTDAFLVFGPITYTPDIQMYERDPYRETFSQLAQLPGFRSGKLAFVTEMVGSGEAGTAPFWGKLMKACGFAETINAGVSVVYEPASASIPTLTLGLYRAGFVERIWGARGNLKLVGETGKPVLMQWEFTGIDFERVDASLLSGVSYSAVIPPVMMGVNYTIDGYQIIGDKLEIDLGSQISLVKDFNADGGHRIAMYAGRKPKMTVDPNAVPVATKDFVGMWQAGSTVTISCTIGSAAGNTIELSFPAAQIVGVKPASRDGILTDELEIHLAMNSGDDEITITLT